MSTAVIQQFEYHEIDGKVNIRDDDHDSAHLFLVDHDEIKDMPTAAKLNKVSVQLQREVELNADAVAEGMDISETVSASAKPELIVKDSSGGSLAVRQISESRTTTAFDPPLSSSTGINQLSLVLSSKMRWTPINSSILCNDYDSTGAYEKTKDIAQFNKDKQSVYER
ncbi:unnamed protein product, partial [Trichobilharzia regenti]